MKKALILNSIGDIKRSQEQGFLKTHELFTTNPCVEVYLKEEHQIESRMLSHLIQSDEVSQWMEQLHTHVEALLEPYDKEIGGRLNAKLGFNMNYFRPLYSYFGKHQYLTFKCFGIALDRLSQQYEQILTYNISNNHYYRTDTDLSQFVEQYCGTNSSVKVIPGNENLHDAWAVFLNKCSRVIHNPGLVRDMVKKYTSRSAVKLQWQEGRPTLLLYMSLYHLSFLPNVMRDTYNILEFEMNGKTNPSFNSEDGELGEIIQMKDWEPADDWNTLDKIFMKGVRADFFYNIKRYVDALKKLANIHRRYPIQVGIWGNPPIKQLKALVFEYLMNNGVHVIGAQHGSVHGVQRKLWQVDSDFQRCHTFMSYGFEKSDLERLYGAHNIPSTVLPVGWVKDELKSENRQEIDILFPITNSMSMLTAGMVRKPPHELTSAQIAVLNYLDGLENKKTCIKPFVTANYETCSVLPILRRMKKVEVDTRFTLTRYLKKVKTKVVIIEYPSTPLFEVMEDDCEIFLLDDPLFPFEREAYQMLRKRVHCFHKVEDMLQAVDLFLSGNLESRRDREFYDHYVGKPEAASRIAEFVEGLATHASATAVAGTGAGRAL